MDSERTPVTDLVILVEGEHSVHTWIIEVDVFVDLSGRCLSLLRFLFLGDALAGHG